MTAALSSLVLHGRVSYEVAAGSTPRALDLLQATLTDLALPTVNRLDLDAVYTLRSLLLPRGFTAPLGRLLHVLVAYNADLLTGFSLLTDELRTVTSHGSRSQPSLFTDFIDAALLSEGVEELTRLFLQAADHALEAAA